MTIIGTLVRQRLDAPFYWWLIGLAVFTAIVWLFWYDGEEVIEKKHGTSKVKTAKEKES